MADQRDTDTSAYEQRAREQGEMHRQGASYEERAAAQKRMHDARADDDE